jgi:hypothetical protein
MPPEQWGAPADGRLNLEQQKKRAKELLKAHAGGETSARDRFATHHPRADKIQLADAQFVIARENGFESWPKMKAHAEALAAARDAMKADAPDNAATLHIRCGSDIRGALKKAGFIGAFHEFADPFCQGPVRDLPMADFIAERARFTAQAYDLFDNVALERERTDYQLFDKLSAFEQVILWFEHDSYDQLILAFLLAQFGKRRDMPAVLLICAAEVPAVSRFVGLGQLSPEVIRWLWAARRPIGAADFAFGDKVWKAITAPSPLDLLAIAKAGTPPIAPMARALMRHLQDLPSTKNGLSLTQQLALETIAEHGPAEARALFHPYAREKEPLPFLGDIMFWDVLRELADAQTPAILAQSEDSHQRWPGRRVSLTEAGRALLAGQADWLSCGPRPRFVGGVEIIAGQAAWRFDRASQTIRLV